MRELKILLLSFSMVIIFGCTPESVQLEAEQTYSSLPDFVISPENNPLTEEKIELGKLLFYDPILSGNKDVSCASCHHPDHGYADGIAFSQGINGVGLGPKRNGGMITLRNAPTIVNSAYNGIDFSGEYKPESAVMFWDNRTQSLEEQAWGPMHSFEEMRGDAYDFESTKDMVTGRLNDIAEYQGLFYQAFGDSLITSDRVVQAIASFERSLVSYNSRFDQYMRGDKEAMSDYEIRGMLAFNEAACANCHNGPMFSDFKLHNLGSPLNPDNEIEDLGGGEEKFRTPTLRNVTLTAPYMHNGSMQTLEEVMEFYNDLGNGDIESAFPLSKDIEGTEIGTGQINAIIAFMETLTDESFDKTIPESVPSGLQVGGKITN